MVQWMFSGALFSAAVGAYLPGAVLVEKTLNWKEPTYVGQYLHALVKISKILAKKKLILIDVVATNENKETLITGKCTVLLRDLDIEKSK